MSNFRESTSSKSEKEFLGKCLNNNQRLDGRAFDEFRNINIIFGSEWGSCYVSLGKTQVMAHVSCEVQTPKSTKPNEGNLYINLDLSPLAAPHFDVGRQSDISVQLNRMLEKCIKDSRAIDLESFCIKVNEKAWALRVDINVLNYEGNILDCASIAAMAALTHFRRPDISCHGEEIVIYSCSERDPIPTVVHHYPLCLSYAIFNDGKIILADPTTLEEEVSDALFSIALNGYSELCGFHLGGSALIDYKVILEVARKAAKYAVLVTELIKRSLSDDEQKRNSNMNVTYMESPLFECSAIYEVNKHDLSKYLDLWTIIKGKKKQTRKDDNNLIDHTAASINPIDSESALLLPTSHRWIAIDSCSDEGDEGDEDQEIQPHDKDKDGIKISEVSSKCTHLLDIPSDASEEEATIILNADRLTKKKNKRKLN